MTKKFLSAALVMILCTLFALPVFAAEDAPARLNDEANLLTDAQESDLLQRLNHLSETYKVDVIIVTVKTIGTYNADAYVEYYYDSNKLGYGENRDGVLLLVAMREREYRILSNGLGADAVSSGEIDSIGDTIAPYLTDKKYNAAFNAFIDECEYQIDGEINGFPFDYTMNLLIALLIGFIVAFIVTGVMVAQLKTVKQRSGATEYVKPGSMRITTSNEFFLYRTVDRKRRENSGSSGSRSGSSRRVGGGKF